jgi:outer membrane protein
MSYSRRLSTIVFGGMAGFAMAQTSEVSIETPRALPIVGHVLRPFNVQQRHVPPARLTNSQRLESLVRAGNLYLSVQDVIALALENNLDIAVQRYATPLAREVVRRTQGGGGLRSIGQPIAPGPASVSTAGVNVQSVGLPESGSGVNSGGGLVIALGAQPPGLDPSLFAYASYQHATTPLQNQIVGEVPVQINNSRQYQFGYAQSFITGTSVQLSTYSFRNQVNSPAFVLDPYTQGFLDLQVSQNLLQGFGLSVNNRFIRVAKNNLKVSDLQLKYQVITTISAVLNLFWDLVSFNQNVRIQEQSLATAQKLYEDNQNQVRLGTLPAIEVTRAAAEVSADKENLLIAQTNVAQQETVLKNALSRNGVENGWLDEVHIIPLDHIVVPEKEELKAKSELVKQALENRPELEQIRINTESSKINLSGTKNALLPTLQAFFELTNNGLSGAVNPLSAQIGALPIPAFVGGYGNLTSQILARNYPNYSAGLSLNIPFRNRAPQADYVADQLNVRQNELQLQKATNQIRVDVQNALIQLQVARARYESAVSTRVLAQQTLDAEQNRFKFGESTIATVVQAQRDMNGDQTAEIQAMANYTHARVAFDEAVGQTLDVNGVSMEEARAGQVARPSSIPEGAPNAK